MEVKDSDSGWELLMVVQVQTERRLLCKKLKLKNVSDRFTSTSEAPLLFKCHSIVPDSIALALK